MLYGGDTGTSDLWAFDGTTWTQLTLSNQANMPKFTHHALAYDSDGNRLILTGGAPESTWQITCNTATPTVCVGSQIVTPSVSGEGSLLVHMPGVGTIAFGGRVQSANGFVYLNDTWRLNGNQWQRFALSETPTSAVNMAATYDPDQKSMLRFGGANEAGSQNALMAFTATLAPAAARWRLAQDNTAPSPRGVSSFAHNGLSGKSLLYGGRDETAATLGDTWELDGDRWQKLDGISAELTPRLSPSMVFDGLGIVMFGGYAQGDLISDQTWRYTESAKWQLLHPAVSPPGRIGAAIASDVQSHRTLVFGGATGRLVNGDIVLTEIGDTWMFDGSKWREVVTRTKPAVRAGAAMTFDVARKRFVMFGGGTERLQIALNDTWEFDGTDWIKQSPQHQPSGRSASAFVYDPLTKRNVLLAGIESYSSIASDFWSWNGSDWQALSLPSIDARYFAAGSYDAVRSRILLFGGTGWVAANNELLSLSLTDNSVAETCDGSTDADQDGTLGCDDPDCWGHCTPLCPPNHSCGP
jgi:hypothetical protein